MSVKITTMAMFQQYAAGVVERANHHGQNVKEVVYSLIGYLAAEVEAIEVRGHQGRMCNVLWCIFGGQRYAFSYTHANGGAIVLRRGNLQGPEIGRFTNLSSVDDFRKAFNKK